MSLFGNHGGKLQGASRFAVALAFSRCPFAKIFARLRQSLGRTSLPRHRLSTFDFSTFPAMSCSVVGVVDGVAGQLVTSDAMCLPGVDGPGRVAPLFVLRGRHRLEMCRVHADAVTAQVVEFVTIWDRTNDQLVGKDMSRNVLVQLAEYLRGGLAVASRAWSPGPNPTGARFGSQPDHVEPIKEMHAMYSIHRYYGNTILRVSQ